MKCLLILFMMFMTVILFPRTGLSWQMPLEKETPQKKALYLNLATAGGILTWGVLNWDYFQKTPTAGEEGWFAKTTKEGGADKMGHMYSSYLSSHLFGYVYESWGFSTEESRKLGFLSSLGASTLVELGDAFSDYGFSYEDMIMNLMGASLGYLLFENPPLSEKIDFRIEYSPDFGGDSKGDISTDYQNMKFLFALKPSGFRSLENSFLRYFELQAGYYARNFGNSHEGESDERERVLYTAIGLNVGEILSPVWKTRIFDYLQLPFTYLPAKKEF